VQTKEERLKVLNDQLDGLSKAVEADTNLPTNIEDYLVTLNSLKKRIEAANKMPDDPSKNPNTTGSPLAGTQIGRTSRAQRKMNNMTPKQMDAAKKALNGRLPITDRRAAIEHTRKLNESSNDS
jgi:hypothetical protein